LQSIDFEALPNQWVALDAATMTAIGVAVGRHIQACFSRAKALADEVAAASDAAALDAINIDVGWP
jgi:leucyl aminopeptidase